MAVTKVTTKVLADDAVTIDKIADAALVVESEGISANDNDTTIPTSAAVKDYVDNQTDNNTTYTVSAADGDNTDEEKIVLTGSDSSTDAVVLEAGTGLTIARAGDKITFTNTITDTDTVLTSEQVEDIVGAMVTGNTETGITVTYDDTGAKLNFVVDDSQKVKEPHSATATTFTVTVDSKTSDHRYSGSGSSNGFYIDSVEAPYITITPGNTYKFDQSDGTNSGHPLLFYYESDKTTAYSTGVTANGTPGSSGAYTTIIATDSTPTVLHYQCSSHALMGNQVNFDTRSLTGYNTDDLTEGTSNSYFTNERAQDAAASMITGATHTNLTATYDDASNTLALAVTGGGSVSDAFKTISISGQSDVVADSATDTLTLEAGSNITLTTDASSDKITIASTASGGGGISWESTVKTADFTATAGEGYFIDTTSSTITVTMPSSPSAGDEVSIVDYAGTADTNKIEITSSNNINGASDDVKIDYERGGVSMVYVDATQGWIAYNAANETATGLINNPPTFDVHYLVIAGGGAGGIATGIGSGGGGAGGFRTSFGTSGGNTSAETVLALLTLTNYTVTVGPGATGPTSGNVSGPNGSNSVFATITSTGGGGGASNNIGSGFPAGGTGGSGGGTYQGSIGAAVTSPVVQGFAGGESVSGSSSGGGGGAGGAGVDSNYNTSTVGDGGLGLQSAITVASGNGPYYAAGGGGGQYGSEPGGPGAGGSSIGGAGGSSGSAGGNGNASTGSGGGGGGNSAAGGNGGSGVVILRYSDSYTIAETTSGGNVLTFSTDSTTVANTKITTFTAGQSGTIQFS